MATQKGSVTVHQEDGMHPSFLAKRLIIGDSDYVIDLEGGGKEVFPKDAVTQVEAGDDVVVERK